MISVFLFIPSVVLWPLRLGHQVYWGRKGSLSHSSEVHGAGGHPDIRRKTSRTKTEDLQDPDFLLPHPIGLD